MKTTILVSILSSMALATAQLIIPVANSTSSLATPTPRVLMDFFEKEFTCPAEEDLCFKHSKAGGQGRKIPKGVIQEGEERNSAMVIVTHLVDPTPTRVTFTLIEYKNNPMKTQTSDPTYSPRKLEVITPTPGVLTAGTSHPKITPPPGCKNQIQWRQAVICRGYSVTTTTLYRETHTRTIWKVKKAENFNLHLVPHNHKIPLSGYLHLQSMDGRFYNWTTTPNAVDANRYHFSDEGKGRLEGTSIDPGTQSYYHIGRMLVHRIPYESAERSREPQLVLFASEHEGKPLHKRFEEIWTRIEEYEDEDGIHLQKLVVDTTNYKHFPHSTNHPWTELVWCGGNIYTATEHWSQRLKGKNVDGPWKECQLINVFATPYHR